MVCFVGACSARMDVGWSRRTNEQHLLHIYTAPHYNDMCPLGLFGGGHLLWIATMPLRPSCASLPSGIYLQMLPAEYTTQGDVMSYAEEDCSAFMGVYASAGKSSQDCERFRTHHLRLCKKTKPKKSLQKLNRFDRPILFSSSVTSTIL